MKNQLLLIEDVEDVGRSGDVVSVKPGFGRNFLLPKKKAVIATAHTLRLQQRLKDEREKKAVVDRKDAEEQAQRLEGIVLTQIVKVDPEGHMYGSVTGADIAHLLQQEGFKLERRNVVLPQPIKEPGVHTISVKLKEGVASKVTLKVLTEEQTSAKEE